jgi:hypothetical protein
VYGACNVVEHYRQEMLATSSIPFFTTGKITFIDNLLLLFFQKKTTIICSFKINAIHLQPAITLTAFAHIYYHRMNSRRENKWINFFELPKVKQMN